MLGRVEFGKRYKVSKGVKGPTTGMLSFQYPFKPPVDASRDGKAVATSVNKESEINTSGTSWNVRLPAKSIEQNKETSEGITRKTISSSSVNRKKGRIVVLDEEDCETIDKEASHDEVFVGESAPSKNEYLLTFRVDTVENTDCHFTVEKVASIARLKHVTAAMNEDVGKHSSSSSGGSGSSKRARKSR